MERSIWGTVAGEDVETAVYSALADRYPMYGGILVDEVETVSERVMKASEGWVLELCHDALHIRRVGSTVYAQADLDLFTYAGGPRPPKGEEIETRTALDLEAELARRADEEFDDLFAKMAAPEYEEPPVITQIRPIACDSCCDTCGCELGIYDKVHVVRRGVIRCYSCTLRSPSLHQSAPRGLMPA